MEAEHSPVLDRDALLDRTGGDRELIQEIAGLFLEDCPQLVATIQRAVSAGDPRTLEHAAHTLKGAVANFGTGPAYSAAFQLEKLGRGGNLAEAPAACEVLEREIGRFEAALQALAAELAQS